MYYYYDYFKGNNGQFYVRWHEGQVSGLFLPLGMTETEAQKWVAILNKR